MRKLPRLVERGNPLLRFHGIDSLIGRQRCAGADFAGSFELVADRLVNRPLLCLGLRHNKRGFLTVQSRDEIRCDHFVPPAFTQLSHTTQAVEPVERVGDGDARPLARPRPPTPSRRVGKIWS